MTASATAPGRLAGKVALVTGASRGIGAEIARRWATEGATVVAAARDRAALERVVDDITRAGGHAVAVRADVTVEDDVRAAVRCALDEGGRLDVACNGAATASEPAPLADVDPVAFDRSLRTNLFGTFISLKFEIRAMLHTGGGAIVNIASTAGLEGVGNLAGYVATKHGLLGLTKVAALDYAAHGIRVNALAPGPILTDRLEQAGPAAQHAAASAMPMRRIGRPRDVADAAAWLCSDEASFITGTTLAVDGGKLAGMALAHPRAEGSAA